MHQRIWGAGCIDQGFPSPRVELRARNFYLLTLCWARGGSMVSIKPNNNHFSTPRLFLTLQHSNIGTTEANRLESLFRKVGALNTWIKFFPYLDKSGSQTSLPKHTVLCQGQDLQERIVLNLHTECFFLFSWDTGAFLHIGNLSMDYCWIGIFMEGKKIQGFILWHIGNIQNLPTFLLILVIWIFYFFLVSLTKCLSFLVNLFKQTNFGLVDFLCFIFSCF